MDFAPCELAPFPNDHCHVMVESGAVNTPANCSLLLMQIVSLPVIETSWCFIYTDSVFIGTGALVFGGYC
jgi:hypothetical protein